MAALLIATASVLSPSWQTKGALAAYCGAWTSIFDVTICVTAASWSTAANRANCDHVANVMAQLLDNDADGKPDDAAVVAYMVNNSYVLWVPATEADAESEPPPNDGVGQMQMTGLWEVVPNSCDTPTNRGASATDRSTWAAAADTSGLSCNPMRDATTEEVLHLITAAAGAVFPAKWAPTYASEAGAAIAATNGNCGWGYEGTWIDPGGASPACEGTYAYDDATCGVGCVVVEGIYWAATSYIGGLYTQARAQAVSSEWLMATPDDAMALAPSSGAANAVSLQSGSPALYALVSDQSSEGHAWLPAVMPDGEYTGAMPAATCELCLGGGGGGDGDGDGDGGSQRRRVEAALPCCDGGARPDCQDSLCRHRTVWILCGVAAALLFIAAFVAPPRRCGGRAGSRPR